MPRSTVSAVAVRMRAARLAARERGVVSDPTDLTGRDPLPRLLTADQLARRWHVSASTLANRRALGTGCPYVRPSNAPLYPRHEVRRFERIGRRGMTRDAIRAGVGRALAEAGVTVSAQVIEGCVDHIERASIQGVTDSAMETV